jgi:glycosyltransferase involved in cell wall biosynthesis
MAALAIVTSSPDSVEGGHLVIARSLAAAAQEAGHDAQVVLTPDCQFGHQVSSYLDTWRIDVAKAAGRPIDRVISLRHPSYAVRHSSHVCWLNHTMREYYDLWPRFAATLSPQGRIKERLKRVAIHNVDRWLLTHNVTEVVAQSHTIQRRLTADFGVKADVLWPPPPQRTYRCNRYGDYIFAVSRLTPLKRIDLLIRALAEPPVRHVRAVIAGDGDSRGPLQKLLTSLELDKRVELVGRISDDEMLNYYAECRAVCFAPLAEDYGFVTVEAFASRKAVLTCTDSGGPAELVRHGENGLVSDPTPQALAVSIARVMDDAGEAERFGATAAAWVAQLTWPATVARLVKP